MEIDISARHFQVTDGLKEHIRTRIVKFDKYALKIESVHVILEVQKFRHIAEIVLLGKRLRLTAKGESADMYAAFDKSYGTIQLQLGRRHEKIKTHKAHRPGKE